MVNNFKRQVILNNDVALCHKYEMNDIIFKQKSLLLNNIYDIFFKMITSEYDNIVYNGYCNFNKYYILPYHNSVIVNHQLQKIICYTIISTKYNSSTKTMAAILLNTLNKINRISRQYRLLLSNYYRHDHCWKMAICLRIINSIIISHK